MGAPSIYQTYPSGGSELPSLPGSMPSQPPAPFSPIPYSYDFSPDVDLICPDWTQYFPETKADQYCHSCESTHRTAHGFTRSDDESIIEKVGHHLVRAALAGAKPYLSDRLLREIEDGTRFAVSDAVKVLSDYSDDAKKAHALDAIYRETIARSSAFDKSSMPPSRLPEPTNQSAWGPQEDDWTDRNRSRSSYHSKRPESRGRPAPPSFIPSGRI